MLELRVATSEDSAAVHDLVRRAFAHYVSRLGWRPGPMDTDYSPLIESCSVHLTGRPIAAAIALRAAPERLWVELVVVEPRLQGRGLGSKLMAFAETEAIRRGVSELRLFTHALMIENRAFYAGLGYEEYAPPVEDEFGRVFLRKPLSG